MVRRLRHVIAGDRVAVAVGVALVLGGRHEQRLPHGRPGHPVGRQRVIGLEAGDRAAVKGVFLALIPEGVQRRRIAVVPGERAWRRRVRRGELRRRAARGHRRARARRPGHRQVAELRQDLLQPQRAVGAGLERGLLRSGARVAEAAHRDGDMRVRRVASVRHEDGGVARPLPGSGDRRGQHGQRRAGRQRLVIGDCDGPRAVDGPVAVAGIDRDQAQRHRLGDARGSRPRSPGDRGRSRCPASRARFPPCSRRPRVPHPMPTPRSYAKGESPVLPPLLLCTVLTASHQRKITRCNGPYSLSNQELCLTTAEAPLPFRTVPWWQKALT